MPTTDSLFVLNNLQAVNTPTNTIGTLPQVQALEPQSALSFTGRQPGGSSYRAEVNAVYPSSANAYTLLGATETAAQMGYAKSGAFTVKLTGTNAATIQLTNTNINTNGVAGDTAFNSVGRLYLYNLSGQDNGNSASMTVGPSATNGNNIGLGSTNGTLNRVTIDGSSRHVLQSTNGMVVNAANSALLITPTAGGTFAGVIYGS